MVPPKRVTDTVMRESSVVCADSWHELYRAAIYETDRSKLLPLIRRAEEAIVFRGRELLTTARDPEEEGALDDALYALRALRSSLQWRTHQARVA